MKCFFCQHETEKVNEKCLLGKPVCPKCCFHISTGAPDYINRMKKEVKGTKEDILAKCAACNPVKPL